MIKIKNTFWKRGRRIMQMRSLCGDWEFGIEKDRCKVRYLTRLPVPGNWKESAEFWNYDGVGWYRCSLMLTKEETTKYLQLRFGGVFRRAEIWLNGKKLAEHEGYQAPFRVNITDVAIQGENLLEVRVDNTRRDDGLGNASILEITPQPIAGIYEQVTLEISEIIRICGIYTPVDIEKEKALILLTAKNDTEITVEAKLTLQLLQNDSEVFRELRVITLAPGESEIVISLPVKDIELWSPENPVLYDAAATLTVNNSVDTFTMRTGFKSLEARGSEFYLNGNPYYLLGFGDDFVFPMGMPSSINKSFYDHGIRRAKEYGFNYVRHHSNVPFEVYLDAADELGLLVQPELALANIDRMRFNEENKQHFLTEWSGLIQEYRHHPCIAMWCGGNEMEWGFPFDQELYDIAKRLDPYRLAASTDGNFMACDANGSMDFVSICAAEYTDYLPWRELKDMFLRDDSGKPQFVHEMGNYATVPAIEDLSKYREARAQPQNLERMAELVRKTGKATLYGKAYRSALELQKRCHKLNIEKARLSSYFCGYHVWTLTDYYETTQGILNAFYEDKAFTAEAFSAINRQEILLWDTDCVVFRGGEEADLLFKISRFGSDAGLDGKLTLTLSDGQSRCEIKHFSGHGVMDATSWHVTMPMPEKEQEYLLGAKFEYGNEKISNCWSFSVCPPVTVRKDKEIYIHYLSRYLFEGEQVPLRHFTTPQPIGKDQLIVTEYIYGGMLEAVECGASMLLLARADTFRQTVQRNSFKTPWWNLGKIWYLNHTNNEQMCGIVEQHPATHMLPYSGSWKMDLFDCVEQAPAVDLDALDLDVEAMVYGVDKNLHRYAYLFEFWVGQGRVLVCTMNHTREDMKEPAVEYMLKSLVNYAMSEQFQPKTGLVRRQFEATLQQME